MKIEVMKIMKEGKFALVTNDKIVCVENWNNEQ
jgi:hypothetical protein